MPSEDLIIEIAKGNQQAFRQLYEDFQTRVYNTSLSYLQNAEEAEEACQDVFVEVYQSAGKFRSDAQVSTWIYRITINKCLDRIRYKQRQKRFAFITSILHKETGELLHDIPVFHHPGVALEQKENAATLFKAIKELPENQQTAFILKQAEGLPQKEIAEIMNMTEKAVESLMQRAKAGLRKSLGYFYEDRRK